MLETTEYAIEVEEGSDSGQKIHPAERALVGFIVFAASLCVGLIAAYVVLFDGRGL